MPRLTAAELRKLIARGESNTVELKVAPPRPTELAERLCGLANANGGHLIIGVEDATLTIVGMADPQQALDVLLRATRMIHPLLVLDPPEPEKYVVDGKQLVVATVPPNRGPIYQSSGVCWVRRGTHTVPLSVQEMLEMANDRGLQSWELQPARKATMQDLDTERIKAFLSQRPTRNRHQQRLDQIEQVLINLDCAVVTTSGDIIPTNAGILFFGTDPQRFLPHSEVVCVLFRDTIGVGGYLDRKLITGTLQELIDEAETFIQKYTAVGARIEGWKRIDLPEYPIEALREAVINAVIHRDYARTGESVRIFMYQDRIEIHSPGLLLPGITVEMMERGEAPSKLRNPVLANLLRDVPGYMERLGTGVRFMLHETAKMGLPHPQFRERSEFQVCFRKAPEETVKTANVPQPAVQQLELLPGAPTPEAMESSPAAPGAWLEQEKRLTLAMQYVQEHGSITNQQYRALGGIAETTALRDLEALVERGALVPVGKGRGRRYRRP